MTGASPEQSPRPGSLFVSKVAIALLSQVIIGVLGIVTYRVIAAQTDYRIAGLIFFAISLNGVVRAVFDLGISRTVIREVAIQTLARHRLITVNHFLAIYLFTVALFFLGFAVWSVTAFPGWFTKRFDAQTANWLISLFFGVGGFGILTAFMQSLLIGAKQINLVNYFETASALVVFGMLMSLVIVGVDLQWIAVAFFAAFLFKMIVQVTLARPALDIPSMFPHLSRRVFLKTYDNLRFNLMVSIALLVHKQMDKIFAAMFLPLEQVGYYTIIQMSLGRVLLLTQSIARVILPEFSSRRDLKEEEQRRFTLIAALNAAITVPLFVIIFLFSDQIGRLLVGNLAADQGALVALTIKIMSIYFGLNSVVRLHRTLISTSRNVRKLALADAVGVGVSLPLILWLTLSYGLAGLAAGMVVFFLVSGPLTLIAAYTKILTQQAISRFLAMVAGITVLSGVIFGGLAIGLGARTWPAAALIVGIMLAYLLYFVAAMIVFPSLRDMSRQIMHRKRIRN